MAFSLQSPAFPDRGVIPPKYSRDGANVSPPLAWRDAPENTQSFALIVEDPDAPSGTFRHWGLYDLEPQAQALDEIANGSAPGGARQVVNDFGEAGYGGPKPPSGHGVHHYHFKLLALNTGHLDVPADARVTDLMEAARPHILDEAELVGTFENV